MTEAELIELIITKRNELEDNRSIHVSKSLMKVQAELIKELEIVFADGDAERLELRKFLDQCAENPDGKGVDVTELIEKAKKKAKATPVA